MFFSPTTRLIIANYVAAIVKSQAQETGSSLVSSLENRCVDNFPIESAPSCGDKPATEWTAEECTAAMCCYYSNPENEGMTGCYFNEYKPQLELSGELEASLMLLGFNKFDPEELKAANDEMNRLRQEQLQRIICPWAKTKKEMPRFDS